MTRHGDLRATVPPRRRPPVPPGAFRGTAPGWAAGTASPASRTSPLLTAATTNLIPDGLPVPTRHTAAELDALLALLAGEPGAVRTVVVGHSRDRACAANAEAFATAWAATGAEVLAVVDWPERAASWLRPARRFVEPAPDAWVVSAAPLGWAQMSRRLRHSTDWDPARTFGFASVGDPVAVVLAGAATVDGLRGAGSDGRVWRVGGPRR